MSKKLHAKFANIFDGSKGTFGQWNPNSGKMHTEKREALVEDYSRHLNGSYGIGRVPINEDGMCVWGAIDIDNHSGDSAVSIETIAKVIYSKGLPLVPCRSKSGGVHCYLFTSEPVSAAVMQKVLKKWAAEIGHSGAEVFPKQTELRDNILGNWINLPYFDSSNTVRYAVEIQGNILVKLSLEDFIETAINIRLTKSMLKSFVLAGHEQAPPCIQELIIEGVPKGVRNEAMYGFTIYCRKRYPPTSYKQEVLNFNQQLFESPLPLSEANRTIQSASRREYKYKCMEEPFRSHCDSKTCLARDYGIEPSDTFSTGEAMPNFDGIKVMQTEPPMWELTINEIPLIVSTKVLRRFDLLAEEIMERLLIVVPLLKQKEWLPILSDLMANVEPIEAPDNASTEGVIREKLTEFVSRADFSSNGKDLTDRDLIGRGFPVMQEVQENPGYRHVMFRGSDFITYLKRTRSEELKGTQLWLALRKMGVKHMRARVNGNVTNVWVLPVDGAGRTKLDYDYNAEKKFVHAERKKAIKMMTKVNF